MSNEDKHWKDDFPISRPEADQITRRDFAKLLAVVSGGMVFGNGVIAARYAFKKPAPQGKHMVCAKSDIPVGGTRSFVLENDKTPYILVHTEDGGFYAYEQKCTHLSCAVYYKPGTMKLECPCHKGWFDVKTGEVLQGPPPRPLKKLDVIFEGENIFVQHTNTTQT